VAAFWRAIDWQRPWLEPYRSAGLALSARLDAGQPLVAALNGLGEGACGALATRPLRFVAHSELPAGEAYETFIQRSACVPTRDNLHDLFNGLVWLRFPLLKRRLNEMQAAEIARCGIGSQRGALRDALTLFDENGALWPAPLTLAEALRARDWYGLFATSRAAWAGAEPLLFGHALLEKLVEPRKAITAHVCVMAPDDDVESAWPAMLTPERLASKPFLPLPVLGVPGWWAANECADFYADPDVFRPLGAGSPAARRMRQSGP
jgi:hypothetical protein